MRLLIFMFIVLLMSCSKSSKLDEVLRLSGDNRSELLKVINHYRVAGDEQKLKAAKYLISNMSDKHSFGGGNIERYDIMFELFDSLYHVGVYGGEPLIISNTWDSLVSNYGYIDPVSLDLIPDYKHISADFMIRNIDLAFEAWQRLPDFISYDFEHFCEYVLPYRAGNEPLEDFRERYFNDIIHLVDTATNISNIIFGFHLEFFYNRYYRQSGLLWSYPIDLPVSKIEKGHRGSCRHHVNFATLIMRSCGLPVTSDRVLWANRSLGHDWNVLMLDSGKFVAFDAFEREIKEFTYKPAKIFRKSFRCDYSLLRSLDWEDVPPEFLTTNETDVTALYEKTYNITVPIQYQYGGEKKKRYGVICVFDNPDWKVVYWGKIRSNRMHFSDMTANVVYMAAYYEQGHIIPASEPFLLAEDGSLNFFNADHYNLQIMQLERKYPLFQRIIDHAWGMRLTTVEAANRPDFSDKKIFFTIYEPPYGIVDSLISDSGKYRYIRFNKSFNRVANYAEIEFYGKKSQNATEERLTGTIIGYPPFDKDYPHPYTHAIDGDLETWYDSPKQTEGWVGLDLGKGNERIITRVRFCPRSDINFILEGDTYELLYWDKEQWNSAGKQIATTETLFYIAVPSGTIYWLRNLSRGKEERIFTYEDGKQIWW